MNREMLPYLLLFLLSVFLASPLAAYITGTLIVADGGQNLAGSGAWTQLIIEEMKNAGG